MKRSKKIGVAIAAGAIAVALTVAGCADQKAGSSKSKSGGYSSHACKGMNSCKGKKK